MGEGFYRASHMVLAPLIRGAWRVHATGTHHVPRHGRAILASNHLSFLDHLVLGAVVDRPIYFISKVEHFENPVKRALFSAWNVIPLQRGEGDKVAFHRSMRVLEEGNLFAIYPEGTRSADGRLYRGHTGVARLALTTRTPVVPVGVVGTDTILPKGATVPRFGRVSVHLGAPLYFDEHYGQENDRDATREVTDRIMEAIANLTGQEVVDAYHPNRAYDEEDGAPASGTEGAKDGEAGGSHGGLS